MFLESAAPPNLRRVDLLPTLGYCINLDRPRTKAELDPVLAPLVKEAFERYASGKYAFGKLVKVMTERKLTSRLGKPTVWQRPLL